MTIVKVLRRVGCLIVVMLFVFSCEVEETALFVSLEAEKSGLHFSNELIYSDSINIIQYLYYFNGAGVGAGDLNGDGKPDVFFASNQGESKLFVNNSSSGLVKFDDVTDAAGLGALNGWSTGVNLVDVNGDGKLDIYLCQVNYKTIKGRNRLLINKGNKNDIPIFEEQSEKYGLDFQGLSTQTAFLDFDLDGDLDMYLLNHSVHSPENYTKADVRERPYSNGDRLYRNDNGVFVDISEKAGIYRSQIGFGLGVGVDDFNHDGYPDIYVGNDFHENDYMYNNNGDGTFSEAIEASFSHTSQFTMGLDIADINNDGFNDIISLDMMPEIESVRRSSVASDTYEIYEFKHDFGYHYQLARNNLQLHRGLGEDGNPLFSEIGQLAGIENTDWSWSCLLADYNCDGLKDVFVSNGIVRRPNDLDYMNYISNRLVQQNSTDAEMIDSMPTGATSNYLFLNNEDYHFANRSTGISNNEPGFSTGAAYADFDNDGDIDIVTNNINANASLLLNQSNPTNYIKVSLQGLGINTNGIGARVIGYTKTDSLFYDYNPTRGFMSCSSDDIVINWSENDNLELVKVIWPNGSKEVITDLGGKRSIVISQLESKNRRVKKSNQDIQSTQLVDFVHEENNFLDISRDKLMPWLLSTQGPALAVSDINKDGLDDIFIGGARGQSAALYLQNNQGLFEKSNVELFEQSAYYEDTEALFLDIDSDGDQDLYVVSGGNEYDNDSPFMLDRIYVNDGLGNFHKKQRAVPLITENGSSVTQSDFDNDGDLDLAVGTIVRSQSYGYSPGGHILVNDGKGKYIDGTTSLAPELKDVGMITDMQWADIDRDGDIDLILAGEWMPITIMINDRGRFKKEEIPGSTGLWQTIAIADMDEDGNLDIVAGNFGTNTYLAKYGKAGMTWGDFDNNRSFEPLLYLEKEGTLHPLAGKDLLTDQMNFFKNLHRDYNSFANASFEEMFAPVLNKAVSKIKLEELETTWYENKGNLKFEKKELPKEVQFAPVFSLVTRDFNSDGLTDIFFGGNMYEVSPNIGRADASFGSFLFGNQKGEFEIGGLKDKKPFINGQIRNAESIKIKEKSYIIVARNNASPEFIEFSKI